MARTAWRFEDPVTEEVYAWPVNPNQDEGSNTITKTLSYTANAALRRDSLGEDRISTLVKQTNFEQQVIKYSGFVYDQAHFDALNDWCNRGYEIELYDDLGRGLLIYPTNFQLQRVRSRQYIYKHSYSFDAMILERL